MNQHAERGRLNPGLAILLGCAAVVLVILGMSGCWSGPFFGGWLGHDSVPFFRLFAPISIWGLISAGLAVWVGIDANKRGLNGVLWGLLVFFTGIVGLIVYLLVGPAMQHRNGGGESALPAVPGFAPQPAAKRCPKCEGEVHDEFKACPFCGTALQCGHCGKPTQGDWKICPYCAAPL
jgi:RNA polymerase subunit RPABC4/transcription elongation factor Spt4